MDLVGNAYEWVNTRYDDLDLISSGATGFPLIFEDVYPYPYRADDGREEDESIDQFYNKLLNSQLYTLRVVRGGSWDYTFTILRGSARDWFYPDNGFNIGGFRCARSD
jgi:formylglycine-generating enzyme required for sulfatase activity